MGAQSGQILFEIVIAAVLIVFVALAITQALTASLRGVDQTLPQVAAVFLSQEMTEALRAVALEDWHTITNLATSSSNIYHPEVSGGEWVIVSGSETVTLDSVDYSRSFYLEDVYRSTSSATSTGNITASGGYYDPSALKATMTTTWTNPFGSAQSYSQVVYYTRYLNNVYAQTDWSGGPVGEVSTTLATTTFATSAKVDYASSTGQLKLIIE